MSSGNKYHRMGVDLYGNQFVIDVYLVLEAFGVHCPARQHAIKKLLCAGLRGKGDSIQDLREATDSCIRALELETRRC